MRLTSPDFRHNEYLPVEFTCEGREVNPAFEIADIPQGTQSLALIMDDPDAPAGTWVHWVVYDIFPVASIDKGSIPGKQGVNTSGEQNYAGPCPPRGPAHRYFFKLYALDIRLDLAAGIDKKTLESAMRGHILGQAELIGLYKR